MGLACLDQLNRFGILEFFKKKGNRNLEERMQNTNILITLFSPFFLQNEREMGSWSKKHKHTRTSSSVSIMYE